MKFALSQRGRRLIAMALGFPLIILLLAACTDDQFSANSGWSGVTDGGQDVYVGSIEAQIVAFDAESGSRVWVFPPDKDDGNDTFLAIYSAVTLSGNTLYVSGYNGKVYSLDIESQDIIGQFEIEGDEQTKSVVSDVVIVDGKAIFGAASDSENGQLYVLDATEIEREICRYPETGTIGKVWSTPTVVDGIAYFGDFNHFFYAVSLEDFSLVWSAPVELDGSIGSTALVVDGTIYVGAFDRNFYAIDAATGSVRSLFTADGWFWSGVVADEERLYIPNMDGTLYAWGIQSERLEWTFPTEGAARSTPVLVGDRVVVASDSRTMYVLNAIDGSREWGYDLGEKVQAPLMAKGSVIYIADRDHNIYAVDIDDRRPVRPWPVSTKD
ncbi:MAG: PQQ-binding-like beta-propeller repeat protein [Chloroflexi bacterium]|nr:PQQ-binding-like beta-propeller repeat protein [Chloroflexota bacterium]